MPWDPRSAPGTPMSLAGREVPGRGGEEPPVPPRPSAGSKCCRGSRRYSPRRHEGPPAPPPSRPASMAFLTAWKGAASGKSDRRYRAGTGTRREARVGRRGGCRQPTGGTAVGVQLGTRCAGCWVRGNGRRAGEGQPSASASHTPTCPLLGCCGPRRGWAWGRGTRTPLPGPTRAPLPVPSSAATCEGTQVSWPSGGLGVRFRQPSQPSGVLLTHLVLQSAA